MTAFAQQHQAATLALFNLPLQEPGHARLGCLGAEIELVVLVSGPVKLGDIGPVYLTADGARHGMHQLHLFRGQGITVQSLDPGNLPDENSGQTKAD